MNKASQATLLFYLVHSTTVSSVEKTVAGDSLCVLVRFFDRSYADTQLFYIPVLAYLLKNMTNLCSTFSHDPS